jgi:hypothetical protein
MKRLGLDIDVVRYACRLDCSLTAFAFLVAGMLVFGCDSSTKTAVDKVAESDVNITSV